MLNYLLIFYLLFLNNKFLEDNRETRRKIQKQKKIQNYDRSSILYKYLLCSSLRMKKLQVPQSDQLDLNIENQLNHRNIFGMLIL